MIIYIYLSGEASPIGLGLDMLRFVRLLRMLKNFLHMNH